MTNMTIALNKTIVREIARALQAQGALAQKVVIEPVTGQGMLVSAVIRDQEVRTLIPTGMTISFDTVAENLIEQLHPDNGGMPFTLRQPLEILPS